MRRFVKLILILLLMVVGVGVFFIFNTPNEINMLLVGVDAGDYANKGEHKRTDTIMLVHLKPRDKEVYIYSIPRDTRVKINGHIQKINAAHAIGGIELLKEKLEGMLGIKIDYYVKVDYKAFRELIDAVGGIDVVIERDMNYNAHDIQVHFKKGEKVHLDGEKAEAFVRWRKNNDGTGYAMGDLGRISTQQEFIIKLSQKLKSPATIFRVPKILNIISKNVETDFKKMDMIKYTCSYFGIEKDNIKAKTLSGEPKYINTVSYYIPDIKKDYEFLRNFKANSNNVDETQEKVKIAIFNATNVNGLAAKYKSILEEKGYEVTEIGNYNKKLSKTIVYFEDREIAEDVKNIIGDVKTEKNNTQKNEDIIVILGRDIVK